VSSVRSWRLCIGKDCRSHHPYRGGDDVLFWPASNHQPLCAACHNQKTTTADPVTKQQRKAGKFREQEEAAVIAPTGCMRQTMTEQEQQRLISGLIKQRESWQPRPDAMSASQQSA
jgi:hypothetical protein